ARLSVCSPALLYILYLRGSLCAVVSCHGEVNTDLFFSVFCLSLSVEIQSCLVSSGDVGCGTFQCFNNNSCEIQGLHHICLTLLHNAGRYDSQGKSFVKDALRCMALGLRQRFSCVSRRCSAVKEMVYSLQRECYSKHQLCLALRDHMDTTVITMLLHSCYLLLHSYYILVNFLLKCGDEVRSWVSRRLRGQCEQHWGALCRSFGSTCSLSQSDVPQHTTAQPSTVPWPITAQGPVQQPTRAAEQDDRMAVSFSNGHGHTRVNTTGNFSLVHVQLMAESQYSTYLSLFLYL
uniref:Stanniocalcin n=1 Tax=Lates calcarifer TaxID=8187 RepID=A0A4W6F5K7_LATCA